MEHTCPHYDGCGGTETYLKAACLPIAGRVCKIDYCIHSIVAALNAGGYSYCCKLLRSPESSGEDFLAEWPRTGSFLKRG